MYLLIADSPKLIGGQNYSAIAAAAAIAAIDSQDSQNSMCESSPYHLETGNS